MGLPLRKLAMKLLFFQILALSVKIVFNLTPHEDQVAPALKVAHFDCSEMTENTLYAINQVRPYHITPEELEISKAKIVLHTKQCRKELNATKCRVQHQREKWHCGHHDHSSIDHTFAGFTSDIVISPEQCRTLAKRKDITLLGHSINFGYDTKNPIVKTYGDTSDDYRNECDGKGWITRDTFLPHMQTTTLKVTLENGKVLSDTGLILPCAVEELGCETTSLDPYAYIWDYPDNCAISILPTEEVNTVKQERIMMLSVEPTPALNLYSKSRTTLRNIVESQRLSILRTTIHFIWTVQAKVLTWTPGETFVAIKMEQPRFYNIWDQRRKAILVNFMLIIPS